MHIYITGGSGHNGRLTIQAALDRGHTVTALVRNQASLTPRPNLTVIQGSPNSLSDVQRALTSPILPSVIISTLSLPRKGTSPFAPLRPDTSADFMSRATQTLLSAVNTVFASSNSSGAAAKPKLVINSSVGVGDSWASMSWVFRLLFSQSPLRHGVADHNVVDGIVRNSGLPFVLARAARLADQEGSASLPVTALPENGKGLALASAVSRQSLAQWLIIAGETNAWDGKSPVLVN